MNRIRKSFIWAASIITALLAVILANPLWAATQTASGLCFPAIHGRICYTSGFVPNWSGDIKQSQKLGITALFHRTGDERRHQPMITLDAVQHFPWLAVSALVSQNVAEIRKEHPRAKIKKMSVPSGLSAQGVIISYSGVWQTLVFRNFGKIIVLTTLQCRIAVHCVPLMPYFVKFLSGMEYTPPGPDTDSTAMSKKDLHSGIVYGNHWMILFSHMPWMPDTTLANRLGVNEIFYPADWDPRNLSPFISLAYDHKTKKWNIKRAVAWDVARSRKKGDVVTSMPPLTWRGGRAALRIFTYKGGWDEVAYSDGGKVIFYVTLHCNDARQGEKYLPLLRPFIRSLSYQPASIKTEHLPRQH